MHPFPPVEDLQFLIGLEIQQIRLDPNSVQFCFAGGGGITVEFQIEHVDEDGLLHPHDCEMRDTKPFYLHRLLQTSITAIRAEPFCLSLTFATGALLRIFGESGGYECGQIYPPEKSGKGIVVF